MFYKFVGYSPNGASQMEIFIDLSHVSAYYALPNYSPPITVVRCDGTDYRLTTPFASIHEAIIESQSITGGLGDTETPTIGVDYHP